MDTVGTGASACFIELEPADVAGTFRTKFGPGAASHDMPCLSYSQVAFLAMIREQERVGMLADQVHIKATLFEDAATQDFDPDYLLMKDGVLLLEGDLPLRGRLQATRSPTPAPTGTLGFGLDEVYGAEAEKPLIVVHEDDDDVHGVNHDEGHEDDDIELDVVEEPDDAGDDADKVAEKTAVTSGGSSKGVIRNLGVHGLDIAPSGQARCRAPFGCGTLITKGTARWQVCTNLRKPSVFVHVPCLQAADLMEEVLLTGSLKFLRDAEADGFPGDSEEFKNLKMDLKEQLESCAVEHGAGGFGGASGSAS